MTRKTTGYDQVRHSEQELAASKVIALYVDDNRFVENVVSSPWLLSACEDPEEHLSNDRRENPADNRRR